MKEFQILQYNVHKSWQVMASFLRDRKVLEASVIAIQEPWKNELQHTTHQPATAAFQLLYPPKEPVNTFNPDQRDQDNDPGPRQPGVCLFVSRNLDPATWSCRLISQDYQLLKLRMAGRDRDWRDLFIHNIYNRPGSNTLEQLRQELSRHPHGEHVVLGDMNAHHPRWGGAGTNADPEAIQLIDIINKWGLDLLTEEGRPTWTRNEQSSVIDLTLATPRLANRLIQCQRADDIEHASDHFPIRTVLDLETSTVTQQKRRNWKATDDAKLFQRIERSLQAEDLSQAGPQQIEEKCQELMQNIQLAVEDSTPWARPSEWSNPDFDEECKAAVKEVRRLRRRHTSTQDPYDWMCYSEARNKKTRLIKKTLSRAHRRRVQQVIEDGPQGMWRLAKWARNRDGAYGKGITPSLKIQQPQAIDALAETIDQKAEAFRAAFFPQPPTANLSDTTSFTYPEPIGFPPLTAHEVQDAVRGAKAGKAPGEDGLPNSLWHKLIEAPVILETMVQLFDACIRTGYNPTHFQRSITVVLRKQGKTDYQLAKSYRPVALISYAVETENLLPRTHLGGRKGISTDHAIHMILDRTKTAWGKGKPVVSLLMLDVSGAYNVSHERLLHNLKKRRLGHFVPWVKSFLMNRSTRIRMPEGISDRIPTPTGIPQGSPISPILYLIYNADLIENCGTGITSNGWVDDICSMSKGDSERETTRKLKEACRKADQWAEKHASVFDPKKYALIHFVNAKEVDQQHTPLRLREHTVPATKTAERYLGYWLDPGLDFGIHREKAVTKAGISLRALRSLAGSTWGASLHAMRKIYQAVIIPQMLFGVSAWYQPMLVSKSKAQAICRPFVAVQKQAACLISGAFRTTAAEALNAEPHLSPISIHMNRLVKETALRLRTGPLFAVPPTMLRRRPADERSWAGWSPMEAQAWKTGGCLTALPGNLASVWESRKAFVLAPWQTPPEVIIEDREKAIESHEQIMLKVSKERPLMIYTDGSGIEGRMGAAVVVDLEDHVAHSQMGDDNTTTVYAAELRAIEMALESVIDSTEPWAAQAKNGLAIFADSQAALKALRRPRMPSGQIYLIGCLDLIRQLVERGIQTELRWIPAHQEVLGNETVDQHAKDAAQKPDNPQNPPNRYIRLAAATKRRFRQEAKFEWERAWASEKTSRPTRRLIETPSKKTLEYWSGLRKATASILMQLRTGRIGLGAYLARINRRDSARCDCDLGNQTVAHVLLECPLHIEERVRMRNALSGQGISFRRDDLLTRPEAREIVADFMVETGILTQFLGTDTAALGMEAVEEKS
ncbi:reverse transcriptase [Penicillium alfredii]|uniref:Reverse transcriptase n=1 Tax=Penicillium alfredii TaxID=1506179 RepID=A0A9W9KMP6_9EURO|nr:reverse transcriptase [Penicillium alfredii]KAJ5111870.1 reverse transcriptase [Penicillium alfredii]